MYGDLSQIAGVRISAIVCTLNRADYLRKAIKSLADQTLSKDQYEIVVVDNGSTDSTKKVVSEEFSSVQNLRYLYEPILGLSQARNIGWQHAIGRYVAYLDDDAVASSNWLEKILSAFETVDHKLGCIGGRVVPIWKTARTPWLSADMLATLSAFSPSNNPKVIDDNGYLAGTNIAFPRHVLEGIGGFQSNLGRKGNKLLSNEEILLMRQIESEGYRCFYHPEIVVWHHIHPNRLTKPWLVSRFYWQGISNAVIQMHQSPTSYTERLRVGFSETWQMLVSPIGLINMLMPTNDPDRFKQKCFSWQRIGYILGLLGIAG